MDRELWFGGSAGRREDERRLVGLHDRVARVLTLAMMQEIVPQQVRSVARRAAAPENDEAFHRTARHLQRLLDYRQQRHVLTFAVDDVSRKDDTRSARGDAIAERLRAESGEHD